MERYNKNRFQKLAGLITENQSPQIYNFVKKDNEGEKDLDIDEMEKIIKQNYESFESSMNKKEFEDYLNDYLTDVSNDVGPDEGAYGNISLKDLLEDFKLYIEQWG